MRKRLGAGRAGPRVEPLLAVTVAQASRATVPPEKPLFVAARQMAMVRRPRISRAA